MPSAGPSLAPPASAVRMTGSTHRDADGIARTRLSAAGSSHRRRSCSACIRLAAVSQRSTRPGSPAKGWAGPQSDVQVSPRAPPAHRTPTTTCCTAAPARSPTPQFDYQRRQRGAVTDPRSTGITPVCYRIRYRLLFFCDIPYRKTYRDIPYRVLYRVLHRTSRRVSNVS